MTRRVVITGLGTVTGHGLGMAPLWEAMLEGRSAIAPITAFDPGGFACHIAAQVGPINIRDFVPKSYRKATKVMARDIELAIVAADFAARDAKLRTRGTDPDGGKDDQTLTYPPARVGCHIGAALIAADLDELAPALVEARDAGGDYDIHKWGTEGMTHLTPLWLLKYLPNMLACHVTIIHGTQGPSNTITCYEASSTLSIGESMRVIQRNSADMCFCGGADSKLNLMAFLRQQLLGRLNTGSNDNPAGAVRPFSEDAAGMAVGEGGAIAVLEAWESFIARRDRDGVKAYAEVLGFAATQTVNPSDRNLTPDREGLGIASAIRGALREAGVDANQIDVIVPFGSGSPAYDQAEAAAMRSVFGDRLAEVPLVCPKTIAGNCASAAGALDVCVAARVLHEQMLPAVINCDRPLPGLNAGNAPARAARLQHALAFTTSLGGQNAAVVLRRVDA